MSKLKFLILLLIGSAVSNAFVIEKDGEELPDIFYDVCKDDFSNCVGAWGKSTNEPGHPCLEFKNCTTVIAFEIVDDHYVFHTMTELVGNKTYVALGFSSDTDMGDDGVVECIKDNKEDKPINIYLSYNEEHSTVRSRNQNGLEEVVAKEENDYLYCKFNLTDSIEFNDLKVSLAGDEEYFLIGVSGITKTENGVVIAGKHSGSRLVSDTKLFKKEGTDSDLPNSFYDVCKDDSNCFGTDRNNVGNELSCVERKNCTSIVAFEKIENHYVFYAMLELQENVGYVGLGLSADQKMGNDGVVECIKDEKEGKPVNVYLSITEERSAVIRSNNQDGLEEIIAKEENNYLYCKFNLTNTVEFNDLNVSLAGDEEYYLFVVSGKTGTDDEGNIIVGRHTDPKFISQKKLFKNNEGGNGVGTGSAILAYFSLICASVIFATLH